MKLKSKILLAVGGISSVVLPLVTVVSCYRDPKEETILVEKGTTFTKLKQLKDILVQARYRILSNTDLENLFKKIEGSKVVAVHRGQMHNEAQGDNDYVILLKEANRIKVSDKTDNMTSFATKTNSRSSDQIREQGPLSTFTERWGITETEFNNSTLMIFLQSESNPKSEIVSYTSIVECNNELFQDEATSVELQAMLLD